MYSEQDYSITIPISENYTRIYPNSFIHRNLDPKRSNYKSKFIKSIFIILSLLFILVLYVSYFQHYQITFYIGLNDQTTKTQQIPTEEALSYITSLFNKNHIDYTYYISKGSYKSIPETTIVITFLDASTQQLLPLLQQIKTKLNQESILQVQSIIHISSLYIICLYSEQNKTETTNKQ